MMQYRLNCGRDVSVEECYISVSTLGYLAGSKDAIRADLIRRLPERVHAQFPGKHGVFIKPVPEGPLPAFTVMVALTCNEPISDPTADFSSLILCWLGDNIETPLPESIGREICSIKWDKHAVDGNF